MASSKPLTSGVASTYDTSATYTGPKRTKKGYGGDVYSASSLGSFGDKKGTQSSGPLPASPAHTTFSGQPSQEVPTDRYGRPILAPMYEGASHVRAGSPWAALKQHQGASNHIWWRTPLEIEPLNQLMSRPLTLDDRKLAHRHQTEKGSYDFNSFGFYRFWRHAKRDFRSGHPVAGVANLLPLPVLAAPAAILEVLALFAAIDPDAKNPPPFINDAPATNEKEVSIRRHVLVGQLAARCDLIEGIVNRTGEAQMEFQGGEFREVVRPRSLDATTAASLRDAVNELQSDLAALRTLSKGPKSTPQNITRHVLAYQSVHDQIAKAEALCATAWGLLPANF